MPSFRTEPMSASRAIDQAARQAALSKQHYGGDEGDMGLGQRQPARMGPMEILSDTQGIDFGPYLAQVLQILKRNWYALIPETAEDPWYKKGKVSIQFAIMKNGQVQGMNLVAGSGDNALDRAAWGGITGSSPFPPLPKEYGSDALVLRIHFFYNPDPNEADLK